MNHIDHEAELYALGMLDDDERARIDEHLLTCIPCTVRVGEAEAAGTGLETSMDVEFTVDLIKKKAIGWPRLENDTHIMVLGSARPLLEAFQHATSELQKWLIADYGFSERGADTFMGQALEYDIANVVDPSFTIVAKIRKTLLPRQ